MDINEFDVKITETRTFSMLCPVCKQHRLSVVLGPEGWQWNGSTLEPSIQFEGGFKGKNDESILCKGHFTITKGQVNLC